MKVFYDTSKLFLNSQENTTYQLLTFLNGIHSPQCFDIRN